MGARGILLLGHFRDHIRYMPFSGSYQTGEGCEILWANGAVSELRLEDVVAAISRRLDL